MEFVDIPDFEGLYKINQNGEILSFKQNTNGKIMKPRLDKNGYYRVTLRKDKMIYYPHIHRLLGKTFLSNPNNYPCIDHINQNKEDNNLQNLRWISYSGNNRNRILPSKSKLPRGVEKCNSSYRARIKIDGVKKHLGCFKTIEEASKVYEDKYNEIMSIF